MYVDVHAHLTHERFARDVDAVVARAVAAGVERIVVNGLEPASNDAVLALCARHPDVLLPALGIYPVDAVAHTLDRDAWPHSWPPPAPFDVEAEIDRIDRAASGLVAVGEVGLDQHWVTDRAAEQEHVFERLCDVALRHGLPVIIHSRRAEERCLEIVRALGVEKADFHCFGGRLPLAKKVADAGYYLSIPPVVERAEGFQRFAQALPLDRLLTETDCPYMGPDKDQRNEPANVPRGIAAMARARGLAPEDLAAAVRENFTRLFGC